jgi:UDP:flavonoid glycosyltransferase YjiC (YdhE family)
MRYLFFPIEIGIAHVSRSLALAEKLHAAGHEIIFALPRSKQELYKSSPVKIVEISPISNKDGVALIQEFFKKDSVVKMIKNERELIQKYKPDWCVVDFRLSAIISSIQENVPFMYVTGSGGLPFGCRMPNPLMPQFIYTVSRPIVETIVKHMIDKFFISLENASAESGERVRLGNYFDKIPYIVPEVPLYLPSLKDGLQIAYIGHLNWNGFKTKKPAWLNDIQPDGKTVYLTFGGTGFDEDKLVRLAEQLLDKGLRVIVSCSSIADPKDFPKNPRLFVERYLPGFEISKKVDIVVCHGGYGTIIEAIMAEKPVVCVPFNPDQMLHSLRFREMGLGEVAVKIKPKDYVSLMTADFEKFEKIGKAAVIEEVVKTTMKVLENKEKYVKAIVLLLKRIVSL